MTPRSALSGSVLALSFLYPLWSDVFNVLVPMFFPDYVRDMLVRQNVTPGLASMIGIEYPHTMYHAATAAVCGAVIVTAFAAMVIRGPYREGADWAMRLLFYGGLISLVVRGWLSLAVYMHGFWSGLEQDVQIPLAFLVAGLVIERILSARRTQGVPTSP